MTLTARRPTAAGLLIHHDRACAIPPIGLIWPAKAAQWGGSNLSMVQGGIVEAETPEAALRRELKEELAVEEPTRMLALCEQAGRYKYYYVFLVEIGWRVRINPGEVAAFGWWWGPDDLASALSCMSNSKAALVRRALRQARAHVPELTCCVAV